MIPIKINNKSGFTLLELMISITIIGVMIFILMGALRLGFRAVEAGGKKMDSLEGMRSSLNVINCQIQSEIPLTYDKDGERKIFFTGNPDFLEFSTNYSIWEGEKGYVNVSYRVMQGDSGKQSLLATENRIGRENKQTIKLLDRFDHLSFEYFYKDPTEEKGKWVEQWSEVNMVPEKIKLLLVIDGRNHTFIIPVRAGGGLGTNPIQQRTGPPNIRR
jgi:general secretion pathway protein J